MASLQEQFLEAGLVDKNKVKLTNQDKSKQKKVERSTGSKVSMKRAWPHSKRNARMPSGPANSMPSAMPPSRSRTT
jgi:hypothetical protein